MSIQARCPNCDASYNLAEAQRGKKVRCRKCSETFVVREDKAGAPAASAAKSAKVRRDALQASPAPPPRPSPKARPAPARRDRERDRDDFEEEEDDRRDRRGRREKSRSALPLILLLCGGVLLLLLMGGGVLLFLGVTNHWFSPAADSPSADSGASTGDQPTDVDDALLWIRTAQTADKQNTAAEWLARATVIDAKRKDVAAVLEKLLASPATRDAGIRGFAQWAGPENVPALIRLVDTDDQWIFNRKGGPAAAALMRLKDKDPSALGVIPVFARRLETDAHADAAEQLSIIGPAAEKEVLKYMDSPKGGPFNGSASEEARKLLASWNTSDELKLNQALQDLKSSIDSGYLRCAADYLAKADVVEARRPEASKALENALADKDGQTRKAAAIALRTWGTKENVTALIAEMDRQGLGESCEPCMTALAALKDETGAEAIARHLTDIFHKDAAFNALRAMGPVAAKAVGPYLTNNDPHVRQQASLLLKSYNAGGDVTLDAVIAGLGSPDADQRKQACDTLMLQKVDPARQKEVSAALTPLLGDPDPFGRVPDAAAKALAVWGDKDSVPKLIAAMASPNSRCWQPCVDALVKLKAEEAVIPLLQYAESRDIIHKPSALRALNDLGPVVETALDNALSNPNHTLQTKIAACGYLQLYVGTKASLPALQTAMMEPGLKTAAKAANDAINKRNP